MSMLTVFAFAAVGQLQVVELPGRKANLAEAKDALRDAVCRCDADKARDTLVEKACNKVKARSVGKACDISLVIQNLDEARKILKKTESWERSLRDIPRMGAHAYLAKVKMLMHRWIDEARELIAAATPSATSCPVSSFPNLKNLPDAHQRCLSIFAAVLASEAAYQPTTEAVLSFLESQTRPIAKKLKPWSMEQYDDARLNSTSEHYKLFDYDDRVIIAFRGTADAMDLQDDLRMVPVSFADGSVHSGFYDRSAVIPQRFLKMQFEQGKLVVFTGHSLGGAIASVLTLRVLHEMSLGKEFHDRLLCITFGAPFIGNAALAKWATQNEYAQRMMMFVYRYDIVPRLFMFRKEAYTQIVSALYETGAFEWAWSAAAAGFEWALPGSGLAFKALQAVWDKLGNVHNAYWAMKGDSDWNYAPMGTFYMLARAGVVSTVEDDSTRVHAFLQSIDAPEALSDIDGFARGASDHSCLNYANGLEDLKRKRDAEKLKSEL